MSAQSILYRSAPRDEQAIKRRTRRLALAVSLCAGALGAAVCIISVIARARHYETPQHPPLGESIYLGVVGFLAAQIVAGTLLKLIGIEAYRPRNLLVWLFVGMLYGTTISFVTGALFPPSLVLLETFSGQSSMAAFIPNLLDSFFAMFWGALTQGFRGLPPGMLAGALLAVVAWLIDRAACSDNRALSTYGALGIGLGFALLVLAFTAFAPASLLSQIGWGPS
jgi:hypothetical protein